MLGEKHENVEYVNSTMSELNGLTDDLYESLIDNDKVEALSTVEKLLTSLKDVRSSLKS